MTYSILTDIERVKRRGSIRTDNDDQLIEELIAEVSADVEDYVGRHIISEARTESYRLPPHDHNVSLRGFPVASVTSVKVDSRDDSWGSVTALATSLYVLDANAGTIFIRSTTESAPTWVQVVYTGGIVTGATADLATSAFVAAYPHVVGSIDQEVVMRLQRRKMPNAGQVVHKGAMKQMPRDLGLLRDTRRRLNFLKPARVS